MPELARLSTPWSTQKSTPRPAWSPLDTYAEVIQRSLHRLCDSLGFPADQRDAAITLMGMLTSSWNERAIGHSPEAPSDITDEHFPIEFSVALESGEPEVRILFESQANSFDQASMWEAAWQVCESLEEAEFVCLDRLRAVADLFKPNSPTSRYAMWHCVCFSRSGPPKFKVYLNPLAQGPERSVTVIRTALQRLGFGEAIQDVFADNAEGELRFFSLDLSSKTDARVKVYRVHYNSTREQISGWLRCVPCYDEVFVQRFWDTIAPSTQRFSRLPVSTYISLDSRSRRPNTATIHFPVRSYAQDDWEVQRRVLDFLDDSADRTHFERALRSYARRDLTAGVGLQSYVAVRLHPGPDQHTTVYLSPEAYQVQQAESFDVAMS